MCVCVFGIMQLVIDSESQTHDLPLTMLIYLQDEVNKLINLMLGEREREIIRLYYGLDNECLTWEDISKR